MSEVLLIVYVFIRVVVLVRVKMSLWLIDFWKVRVCLLFLRLVGSDFV